MLSEAGGGGDGSLQESGTLPRLRLDELLEEIVGRANEVLAARDALRKLLTANRSIMAELSLPAVLKRVVECACELVGAKYAALGVIGMDGTLEQFVHCGLSDDQAKAIGPLPRGKGLLGALIEHPEPIILCKIGADPRSVGFPPNHPPMESFLGVPIRLRDAVYGNLYLSESTTGHFTEEDVELAVALAGTAAVAIENARLFQESQRRQQWLQASTEITARLLSQSADPLSDIAAQVRDMADADVVSVVLPQDADRLIVAAVSGTGEQQLLNSTYQRSGTLSRMVIESGNAIRIDHTDEGLPFVQLASVVDVGPVMALPLTGSGTPRGALVVGRLRGRPSFTVAELDMAATFAGHAAVAIELADARATKDRVALLEDRDRIARDLHDHVIQRLFAAGLTVQSLIGAAPPASVDRMSQVVDDIDETIRQIRTTIFALHAPATNDESVRAQLLAVIDEAARVMPATPEVRFSGPVNSAIDESLVLELSAVVREALSNVVKHAQATAASVEVSVVGDTVRIQVVDDGIGVGDLGHRSGVNNLQARAERHGGQFDISHAEPRGTKLTWSARLN